MLFLFIFLSMGWPIPYFLKYKAAQFPDPFYYKTPLYISLGIKDPLDYKTYSIRRHPFYF